MRPPPCERTHFAAARTACEADVSGDPLTLATRDPQDGPTGGGHSDAGALARSARAAAGSTFGRRDRRATHPAR